MICSILLVSQGKKISNQPDILAAILFEQVSKKQKQNKNCSWSHMERVCFMCVLHGQGSTAFVRKALAVVLTII